jgi:hypothetical protein
MTRKASSAREELGGRYPADGRHRRDDRKLVPTLVDGHLGVVVGLGFTAPTAPGLLPGRLPHHRRHRYVSTQWVPRGALNAARPIYVLWAVALPGGCTFRLSDCETALACDDGSTFADDFAVAGGISGNGVPTPPGTTPTTARAFADPGTGHDDDAVCDDDEDPD